jgi:hypothetical protein
MKTNSRPEPKAFMFRRQHPGESKEEYAFLKGRAQQKFNRGKNGRAKAIKGMLAGKSVGTHVPAEEPPGGSDEP